MQVQLKSLHHLDDVYVVGGAVRDLALGLDAHRADIDLVVPELYLPAVLRDLSVAFGKAPFVLCAERRYYRFVAPHGECDISPLVGTIEDNLAERDFTVNAMALPLGEYLIPRLTLVIDPFGGMAHIASRLLCTVHSHTLSNDPLRILRAARMMGELGFTASSQLMERAIESSPLLSEVAGERVWSELSRVLNTPTAPELVNWLARVGAVDALFSGLGLPPALEHDRCQFTAFFEMWACPAFSDPTLATAVRDELAAMAPRLQAACKLGVLLLDIGNKKDEHPSALVLEVASRLKLSSAEARALTRFIDGYQDVVELAEDERLSVGQIYRVARRTRAQTVPIALFALSESLGRRQNIEAFLTAWFFRKDEVIEPKVPLSPRELINELGREPGPWVKETLDYLGEQTAMGLVPDRETALALAHEFNRRP